MLKLTTHFLNNHNKKIIFLWSSISYILPLNKLGPNVCNLRKKGLFSFPREAFDFVCLLPTEKWIQERKKHWTNFPFELSFPFSFISDLFQFAFHVQQTRQHIKLQKGIKENLFNFWNLLYLPLFPLINSLSHAASKTNITNSKPITKENRKFKEENMFFLSQYRFLNHVSFLLNTPS